MASLFQPDVPQPNPAVAQQQRDEQARAERARINATQDELRTETLLRGRRFGIRSLTGAFFGSGNSLLGSG
jgi:hypothetical protein